MTTDGSGKDGERLDLSALDDPDRFDRLVGRIRQAATPELLRRQAKMSIWGAFAQWRRAILVASSGLAIVSIVVLALIRPTTSTEYTLAESLGIPQSWAASIERGENPGPGDILGLERSE